MTDPLTTALAEALSGPVADAVVERLQAAQPAAEVVGTLREAGDPWRAYTAQEAAEMLGITTRALYAIDPELLPPTYTGPAGGRKMYLRVNLICYLAGVEPADVQAAARQMREEFLRQARPPEVRPLHGGRVRVH